MYEGVNMDELEILDQEAEVPAIDEELADEIGL